MDKIVSLVQEYGLLIKLFLSLWIVFDCFTNKIWRNISGTAFLFLLFIDGFIFGILSWWSRLVAFIFFIMKEYSLKEQSLEKSNLNNKYYSREGCCINEEGINIRNHIKMNSSGIKVGNVTMDSKGITINGELVYCDVNRCRGRASYINNDKKRCDLHIYDEWNKT